MGEVWRAHDTATDRVVAVKVLLPHFADDATFQQRFRREAHAAAALQDPHVVPIHNYGVIDGRLYVDMRFIEGRDLHSLILDDELDPTRAVHIIEQVAMALESAHAIGLIHRDIKPANVLVGKYDFAYLIDFGIAVVTGQTALTNAGMAVGTWAYMAPERFGTGQSDARTDIYALACVLFECLTRRSPFPGTDAQQVIVAHLTSDPPRVTAMRPDLPTALDAVIAKGMAKEPDDRFQSAIELAEAARAAVIPRATPAPASPAPVAGPPPSSPPVGAPTIGPPPHSVPPQSRSPSRPPGPPPRPRAGAPTAGPRSPGMIRYPSAPGPRIARPNPAVGSRPPLEPQLATPSVNLGTSALGLGVGTTNLVAMRDGRPAATRKAVVTLYPNRSPEVGVPGENPNLQQPGLVLTSFVERVGDPVALVAADGSSHRAEAVLVDALDAMTRTVGGGAPVTITVPSHWSPTAVESLRAALRGRAGLSPERAPAMIIPDAGAALACLSADPGLPPTGVVVLCDIGGTGTNITLADASAGFSIIGETVRHNDFSGDAVDQAVLSHVVDAIARERGADPASTAAVAALSRLRDDCRRAKERLSTETSAVVSADLRGRTTEVRITRSDLERLIDKSVHRLVDAVDDVLLRHRVPVSSVSVLAAVGGGAAIPLVAQRLSEQLGVSVVTTPAPQFANVTGAVIAAARGPASDAATGLSSAADDATALAATMGWAGNTPYVTDAPATRKAPPAQLAEGAPATRKAPPAQLAALAWSQDDHAPAVDEYTPAYDAHHPSLDEETETREPLDLTSQPAEDAAEGAPSRWYARTPMVLGAAAAAVLLTAGGIAAVTLTGDSAPIEPAPPPPSTSTGNPLKTVSAPPPKPKTTPPPTTTPPPPKTTPPPTRAPVTTKAPPPVYTTPKTTWTPPPTTEPEPTVEPTEEPTVETPPSTFPTVPTVPTLPPLFPELTLPPLFPEAPQP